MDGDGDPEVQQAGQQPASPSDDRGPDISVIVPCRNAMPFLPWAVDDLARSTGCRLEILICDDGSTDDSGKWLRRLDAALASSATCSESQDSVIAGEVGADENENEPNIGDDAAYDPITVHGEATRSAAPPSAKEFVTEVSWPGEADVPPTPLAVASRLRSSGHVLRLLSSGGRGQGAAQNLCLEAAAAPLIGLMDSDDRTVPYRFERLLKALADEEWDAVCCTVKIFGTVSSGMARYVEWQNGLMEPKDLWANRFVEIPGLHQSGLYPRHVLRETLGGYRDLPSWPIDIDTWMRLAEARVRIGKVPGDMYGWRQHVLQSTRNHGRCGLEHLRRCKAHFLLKVLPPSVTDVEVWSTGHTLVGWANALRECHEELHREPVRQLRLRLVEWRPRKNRRGGKGRRHGDVAEETPVVDNSVDPSSQSTGHVEPSSVIVERVDMEMGALPPPLADCESTSRVFAFGNGDIRDQLRRACQEGTSDVVGGGGRRWSRLDWAAA